MTIRKNSKQSTTIPTDTAPTPPATYAATRGKRGRRRRPIANQAANAGAAGAEIAASKTYTQDFGANAPSASVLGAVLTTAGAWSQKQKEANLWQGYVQESTNDAWQAAFGALDGMAVQFDAATKLDPSVVDRYPHLAKVLVANREVARVGVGTRASNKRKEAEAAKEKSDAAEATVSPVDAVAQK